MQEPLPVEDEHYFPLPKERMQYLFNKIYGPVVLGESVTVKFPPKMGGSKAILRSCWENRMLLDLPGRIGKKVRKNHFSIVEGGSWGWKCHSKYDFIIKFEETINNYSSEFKYNQKDIIVVLRGVNTMEFTDKSFWQDIAALRKEYSLNFVFILFGGRGINISDPQFDPISRCIRNNYFVVEIENLNTIDYVINRWGKIFSYTFKVREKSFIKRYCNNSFTGIKLLCHSIAYGNCDLKEIKYSKRKLLNYMTSENYLGNIRIIGEKKKSIYCGYCDITESFTNFEASLFIFLLSRSGRCVTRDEISQFLWGTQNSYYSSNSINQYVCRIRKKISEIGDLGISIKTVYGKGYIVKSREPLD